FSSIDCPLRDLHSFPTRRSSDLLRAQHIVPWHMVIIGAGSASNRRLRDIVVAGRQEYIAGNRELNHLSDRPIHAKQVVNREIERSEEHTSELQSLAYLVCRLLLE